MTQINIYFFCLSNRDVTPAPEIEIETETETETETEIDDIYCVLIIVEEGASLRDCLAANAAYARRPKYARLLPMREVMRLERA